MPWCPKCGYEYDEGITICYDCQCELVDALRLPKKEQSIQEAFLMTVANEIEFLVVESKLREYGIPVLRGYREAGAFTSVFMGLNKFGLDIFVPDAVLTQAQEIMELSTDVENGQVNKED